MSTRIRPHAGNRRLAAGIARRLSLVPVLFAVVLASCADSPTGPSADQDPQLVVVSGNAQTGVVGQMLPAALTVRVGTTTNPGVGVLVNFVVASGGGSVWAGSALTDSRGIAREWWTLGPRTDSLQVVEVRTVLANGVRRVHGVFTATPVADVPASIVRVVPRAVTAELLPVDPRAGLRVFDRFGNPVPNYLVQFNVVRGGGTASDTVRTDATGLALATWTPGAFTPEALAQLRMRAVGFRPPSADSVALVQTRVYPVTDRTLIASNGDGQTAPINTAIRLCAGILNGAGDRVAPHANHVQAVTWTRNGTAIAATSLGIVGDELCYTVVNRTGANDFRATIRGMAGEAVFAVTGT